MFPSPIAIDLGTVHEDLFQVYFVDLIRAPVSVVRAPYAGRVRDSELQWKKGVPARSSVSLGNFMLRNWPGQACSLALLHWAGTRLSTFVVAAQHFPPRSRRGMAPGVWRRCSVFDTEQMLSFLAGKAMGHVQIFFLGHVAT